jgi:hypothetical protein
MSEYAGNLVAAGVRRRRVGGFLGLAVAVALFIAFVLTGAPRAWRLVLFLPLIMCTTGFFQASEKTCVALGAVGKREVEGGGTCPLRQDERAAVSVRVTKVLIESFVVAALATALALAV